MKNTHKLALMAALAAPIFASAQLVTISGPLTAANTAPSGSAFHDLAYAMTNDNDGLYSAPFDSPADPRDLSTKVDIRFTYTISTTFIDGGVWAAGHDFNSTNAINFTQIDNKPFFQLTGNADIAYIGNESGHDNELWVTAWKDGTKTVLDTDTPKLLADYDAADPNPTAPLDVPPVSWSIGLEQGTNSALLEFMHWNRNLAFAKQKAYQSNVKRFTFWAGIDANDDFTGDFLMAISDRAKDFDRDQDDGLFYFRGDITPVPEPSQIAGIALLGLGAFLFIRRRLVAKK